MKVFRTWTHSRRQCSVAEGVHGWVAMRPPPLKQPAYAKGYGVVKKGKQSMKSKLKSKLVAFLKEAIRAAVAAVMGVAGAALAGCTAVTTPADASHTIGGVGFGVPFGIQVNK